MNKFCIFCGENPETKTKEHIIPLWVLKMTGDPNRKTNLGLIYKGGEFKKREYSFNSFHFPACDTCNNIFGKLETACEPIMNKLIEKENVNQYELTILLDWLDKVRVGLWLGYHQLDKNLYDIKPHYYVAHRVRAADRMFALYRLKENFKGVTFGITQSPVFNYFPICFYIYINQLCLFNISTSFIYAHNLGFPFPANILYDGTSNHTIVSDFKKGIHRIKKPIHKNTLINPSFEAYQAVWNDEIEETVTELYREDYVVSNSLYNNSKCSNIFIKRENIIKTLENEIETETEEIKLLDLDKKIFKQTIDTLNELVLKIKYTEDTTTERKRYIRNTYRKAINVNNAILKQYYNYLDILYKK